MPHFTVRSAVGPVSILNPVSVDTLYNHASGPITVLHNTEPQHVKAQRQHLCPICGKNFTTSGHLIRHNRIHDGSKDFVCPYQDCYKSCSRQDNLTQHYRVHLPMEDRKQPNSHVRGSMMEMRQQLEQLAPLPTEVKKSPFSIPAEGTPLIDSVLATASPTHMLLTSAATSSPLQLQANRSWPTLVAPETERWPPAPPSNRSTSSDSRRPPRASSSSTSMSSNRPRPPPLSRFARYELGEVRDPEHNLQEQSTSPLTPFTPSSATAARTEFNWSSENPKQERYPTHSISYARGQ